MKTIELKPLLNMTLGAFLSEQRTYADLLNNPKGVRLRYLSASGIFVDYVLRFENSTRASPTPPETKQ